MKKIIFAIFITFRLVTKAQTSYIPTGTYKWVNGNDTLTVFMKTEYVYLPIGNTTTQKTVLGFLRFVKNGQVLVNEMNMSNSTWAQRLFSFSINCNGSDNGMEAIQTGLIYDRLKNKHHLLIIEKLNANNIRMKLSSYQQRKKLGFQQGYTFPTDIILTKE